MPTQVLVKFAAIVLACGFGFTNFLSESVAAEGDVSGIVSNSQGATVAGPRAVRTGLPGTAVVWGDDSLEACDPPPSLTNAAAIAIGGRHALAARDDGSVLAWGSNATGQTDVPGGLMGVIAVAAGADHSLALTSGGKVVAWGGNTFGEATVPSAARGNVVAIAAAANQSLALSRHGTVISWGRAFAPVPAGLMNATAIAAGETFCLALTSRGTVVAWGKNNAGQCTVPAGLSNVVSIAAGGSHALALGANGIVIAWGANGSGQINVPSGLNNVMGLAAGTAHCLALRNNATPVAWGDNTFGQTNAGRSGGLVKLVAAGGHHSMIGVYSPLVQYPIDVTRDLLLIYNARSADSSKVLSFYLANRPMVSGANVLALPDCPTNFSITRPAFTRCIKEPLSAWLAANPTKRPQYLVLFIDVPVRINANAGPDFTYSLPLDSSVSYEIWFDLQRNPAVRHAHQHAVSSRIPHRQQRRHALHSVHCQAEAFRRELAKQVAHQRPSRGLPRHEFYPGQCLLRDCARDPICSPDLRGSFAKWGFPQCDPLQQRTGRVRDP